MSDVEITRGYLDVSIGRVAAPRNYTVFIYEHLDQTAAYSLAAVCRTELETHTVKERGSLIHPPAQNTGYLVALPNLH